MTRLSALLMAVYISKRSTALMIVTPAVITLEYG